jgi:outer membrane protein
MAGDCGPVKPGGGELMKKIMTKSRLNGLFDQVNQILQSSVAMKFSVLVAALLIASIAAPAQTNVPEVRNISLQDCLQGALAKNLDLRIARYSPPQAQLDLMASYAGYNPNFNLGGQHSYSRSGGGLDPTTHLPTPQSEIKADSFNSSVVNGLLPSGTTYALIGGVSEAYGTIGGFPTDQSRGSAHIDLAQPLLKNFWIDGTRLNIQVAKNQSKYSELGLKQTIMSTATLVEKAYYDLIAARANVEVQEKAVELATALVVENRKRVEVGALAPLDAQDAEAQAASTQAALIQARQALATQLEVVKGLIGDDFAAWAAVDLVPIEPLNTNRQIFALQQSWGLALTQRPDLLQSRLDLEKQGINLKYNYNQLFPELDLVGSYGHNASGGREFSDAFGQLRAGSQPSYYYGAQLTFPLGNTAARAAYKKGKLTMETLVLELKKLEQNIMIEIHNDIGTVNADYDNLEANRKAREFAEASLQAEQKKLENGKSTTYTVLQKQRDLTTARANEIQALANYNKALSELSFDESTTLERLRINVDVK